jgi:hypothetical protein
MNRPTHRSIVAASIALLLLAVVKPAYCWDKFGHEVIAQIAYDHMTPRARHQAALLVAQFNTGALAQSLPSQYMPYNFVTAAAEMDDQKDVTRKYNVWHYIDLPDTPDLTAADVRAFTSSASSNVYEALTTYCLPTMRNSAAAPDDRAQALVFFLHLAGDIHQPLHAIGRERGGNEYEIDELPSADPSYPIKKLHPFWDNAYRYSGANDTINIVVPASDLPRIAAPGDDPIASFARQIEKGDDATDKALAADLDPADWAVESQHIAVNFAFPADGSHTLTPAYVQHARNIACRRLDLAGLRIAAILNSISTSK